MVFNLVLVIGMRQGLMIAQTMARRTTDDTANRTKRHSLADSLDGNG
jgi:hypothetical protein